MLQRTRRLVALSLFILSAAATADAAAVRSGPTTVAIAALARGNAVAYDSTHDVFVALIGDQTWIYDPSADSWSRTAATIERPENACSQSITYDPAHDVFVYAGGHWGDPNWSMFRFAR